MDRAQLDALQAQIEQLRDASEDVIIISVGVRGPNLDCSNGNAIVTVQSGRDEATAEALHLEDAISIARAKIARQREAKKRKESNVENS